MTATSKGRSVPYTVLVQGFPLSDYYAQSADEACDIAARDLGFADLAVWQEYNTAEFGPTVVEAFEA